MFFLNNSGLIKAIILKLNIKVHLESFELLFTQVHPTDLEKCQGHLKVKFKMQTIYLTLCCKASGVEYIVRNTIVFVHILGLKHAKLICGSIYLSLPSQVIKWQINHLKWLEIVHFGASDLDLYDLECTQCLTYFSIRSNLHVCRVLASLKDVT